MQLQVALRRWQRPVVVVGTKSDKLSNNALRNSLFSLQRDLGVERILPCSANKRTGLKELWAAITTAADL
jgi:GTP-binding protein